MRLAVPKGGRHRTKQEFVHRTLREAILKCELAPGERLVIDELARRLEVSSIPVREALQLLQSEGLVTTVPHVGATVAPLSRESVAEVFTVMEGLEIVATRAAAQRASEEDLDALQELVALMDHALSRGAHEQWAELNTRFHLAISRLTGMPLLQEMMERALGRWDRVRRFYRVAVCVKAAWSASITRSWTPCGRRPGPAWRRRSASTIAARWPPTPTTWRREPSRRHASRYIVPERP